MVFFVCCFSVLMLLWLGFVILRGGGGWWMACIQIIRWGTAARGVEIWYFWGKEGLSKLGRRLREESILLWALYIHILSIVWYSLRMILSSIYPELQPMSFFPSPSVVAGSQPCVKWFKILQHDWSQPPTSAPLTLSHDTDFFLEQASTFPRPSSV